MHMKLLDYQSDASRGGKFRLGKHFGKQARVKSERVSLVIIALLLQKITNSKCCSKNLQVGNFEIFVVASSSLCLATLEVPVEQTNTKYMAVGNEQLLGISLYGVLNILLNH